MTNVIYCVTRTRYNIDFLWQACPWPARIFCMLLHICGVISKWGRGLPVGDLVGFFDRMHALLYARLKYGPQYCSMSAEQQSEFPSL